MNVWGLLTIAVIVKAADLSNLEKLNLSKLDNGHFDAIFIPDFDKNDEWFENSKNLAKNIPFLSKDLTYCYFNVLKIMDLPGVKNLSKPLEYVNFIKDPCLTILAVFEDFEDLKSAAKQIKVPHHPYFFATNLDNKLQIFEVQTFADRIQKIDSANIRERRSNLSGVSIRMVKHPADRFWIFMEHLQTKLNFTVEEVAFEGFGALVDGKWNGAVRQLIDNKIDVGKLNKYRILQ